MEPSDRASDDHSLSPPLSPYSNFAAIFQDTAHVQTMFAAQALYHTLGPRRNSWANDAAAAAAAASESHNVIVPPNAPRRLGSPFRPVQRLPRTRPNAPKAPARSLMPKLYRMPPTQTASRSRFSTPPISTAEEDRLLGSYGGRYDAEAVPISHPMTRNNATALKIGNPRGLKPQNNLNRQPFQPGPQHYPTLKPRAGIQNQLQTEIRRGDNVEVMPHSTVLEDSFTVPAAKRRKTTHQTSSPNSGSISDEVLDRLGPQGVTFGSSQIASQAPSAHSQEIGIQIKRGGSSTGSLTEHKSVERMMNSDPITKKKARRANSQIQQYHHGLPIPLPSISTASQPIDISGEDDEDIMDSEPTVTLPKPLYRGTARVPPSKENAVNTSRLFQTGDTLRRTSPYFTNRFSVENRTDGTRNHGSVESQIPKRTENQSGRLASKFVFESGARRGSGFHLSSDRDELDQTGNTVRPPADARAFSPTKQARRSSPSKGSSSTRKAESDAEQQDGLDRSTIKHSTWLSPEPKDASDVRNIGGRIRDGESKPPLDFELAAISVCESLLHGNDWALVHDASNESYRVQKSGRFFTARNSSLRIDPEKLQKIDFGTSGGKVRFSSSKSGNDDYVLDLQFRKEKDTAAIVKRLSNACSGKVTSHESEHMDKIFEKRRAEFEKQAPNNSSRLLLQKLQVPVERQQMSGTGNVKNQRKTAHLVDHLMDTASYGDDMELSVRKGRSRSTILPDSGSRISGEVTKAPRELITHPEHNSHLRRSSRTSGATRKASEHPFDASDDVHNDVPPYERFSKIHGLGLAWNKPLTYPKAGKKKITVEWSDLERLDEGEFLNDNLVGFYLRYLEQCLQDKRPDLAKRVYFFNTYFYATLTNAHKPKKSFNYEGVQKWTKYVDIFTYDYIIVPICEFSHWYMAIICNLPHLDRVVMLEEGSHFQTEIGSTKTANEHNEFAPPLSSPIDEMSQRDTTTLVDDEKEPDERDARNSFAEMSLDKDAREPATNHADLENIAIANIADAQADDQEMLDAQFEDTLPGSAIPKVSDDSLAESAKQQVEDIEDPIEDPDQPAKVTAKTKRQKRKSMPPPVVTNTDPSKPAIIIFDSLGQTRSATLKVLKEYLKAEAKIKRGGMEVDTTQINGINAKVPQQDNFSDCGLFLLGYMSKFLEDDPKDFITKIIKRQYTRKEDWTNLKPSIMRADLRDQIQELYKVQKDEERESAIKAGKYKGDQKPQSSPTPAPFGRNEKSNRDGQKKEAKQERTKKDENASTGKSTPKSTLDPPRLEGDMLDGLAAQLDREAQNTSKVAKPTHEGDSGNKQAERVRQNTERDIEASAAPVGDSHHRGDTPRTRKPLADLASTEPNVPCVIEIESQSQQGASVLRSVRHSQHSFEKRDESELPSEVPDSQPSNPAKISPQVVIPLQSPKKNLTSPERSETSKSFEQIVSVSAKPSRILDALTGSVAQTTSTKKTYGKSSKPQGERSDRASRRKTTTNMLRSTGVDEVIDIDD